MAMQTYNAIRAIEKVIEAGDYQTRGWVKCDLRAHMLTRLSDAACNYLRRCGDKWSSVRNLANEVNKDVADAICFPDALTPEQLSEVVGLYGSNFSLTWKIEPHFAKLLAHVPGGAEFQTSQDMSWTNNMKVRAKLKDAMKLTLPMESIRKHNGVGSQHDNQVFAATIGAFGFIENQREGTSFRESITYFFDNADDLVLAKMKYS